MGDVTLSNAVRNNLLSLQQTADLLGKTQNRLSTGLKVNSALDDPTAFFTASSLNARAGDLNRLLDSVGNAVQTVRAADQGLTSITKLVESAQATARQALQKPTATNASVVGTGATVSADVAATTAALGQTLTADAVATATGADAGNGTSLLSAAGLADGDTLSITVGDESVTFESNAFEFDTDASVAAGNTLVDTGDDLDTFVGTLNTAFTGLTVDDAQGATGANATTIRFAAADAADDIAISASGTVLAELDIGSVGNSAATDSATQQTITPTSTEVLAFTGTLSIAVGSGTPTTLDLTTVNNIRDLAANLTAVSNGTLSVNTTTGAITAVASDVADDITIGGAAADLTALFGAASGGATSFTVEASNTDLAGLAGNNVTINIGGAGVQTIAFGTDDSSSEISNLTELNNRLSAIQTAFGGGAVVSADATGNLTVTAGNDSDDVVIGGTDLATVSTFGVTDGTFSATNNVDRTALETEFNALRTQIDQLAADSSFNGVNLLNGDSLSVIFNEDGTSSLDITGVTFNSAGLGISAAATDSFQSNTSINASLAELTTATSTLRQQASTFGSNLSVVEIRQDFTKNLINTLETGAANLTLADTNEEGANLLALQTRQQLSSVALSLASQADQNVLRLF